MSKNILIVENDGGLSRAMKDKLSSRGFSVEETNDGKGAAELVRKKKPDLVVLAVDLAAGQSGYIICKKLKSDDELKSIPIVIIGNPDGFVQHKKLKTHADDYLGKPFDPQAIVERAGNLIGFPPAAQEVVEDDSLKLDDLLSEDKPAEDLALETSEEVVSNNDPDFEMVDAVFDDKPATTDTYEAATGSTEPVEEELRSTEITLDEPNEKTVVGFMPSAPPPPPPPSGPSKSSGSAGGNDAALKAKIAELTGQLEASRSRADELESRVGQLENDLTAKQGELETARATSGKSDNQQVFTLKEQLNKKDKEILKLKGELNEKGKELNEKEQEVIDLREKETTLEQKASESDEEIAKRDAQIKTLTQRADQLLGEKKKIEGQLNSAREEARSATAQLETVQSELETAQQRVAGFEDEISGVRTEKESAESARDAAESQLSEVRGEVEALRSQLEERTREADEAKASMEQKSTELDELRNQYEQSQSQLTTQATAFAEEASTMRKKIGDLEEAAERQERRVKALQAKNDKVKEALQSAMSTLDEPTGEEGEELSIDELAEA